ncbi:MAG: hypothetical protein Q4G59_09820, partial [Planctomycetia bacterium]|nr:hypothetical protein [Planctomycetia bacterium]
KIVKKLPDDMLKIINEHKQKNKKGTVRLSDKKQRDQYNQWKQACEDNRQTATNMVYEKIPRAKQLHTTLENFKAIKCQLEYQIRLKYFDDKYKPKWETFKKEFEKTHPRQTLPDHIVLYESRGYSTSRNIDEKPKAKPEGKASNTKK